MSFGMTEPRLTKLPVQGNRKLLIGMALRVCEWEAEEEPQLRLNLFQVLSADRLAGESTGKIIACIHARLAAEHVARKLIGQKNECQRGIGFVDPRIVLPIRHRLMQVYEAIVKHPIEDMLLRKPVRLRRSPEADDRAGGIDARPAGTPHSVIRDR